MYDTTLLRLRAEELYSAVDVQYNALFSCCCGAMNERVPVIFERVRPYVKGHCPCFHILTNINEENPPNPTII